MWNKKKKTPLSPANANIVGKQAVNHWQSARKWLEGSYGRTLLLLAISLSVAALLTPGRHTFDFPLNQNSVGQVCNQKIKAWRDVTIENEEATERLRQEAVDSVLPVYDHDTTLLNKMHRRIQTAFEHMRSIVASFSQKNPQILKPKNTKKQLIDKKKQERAQTELTQLLFENKNKFETLLGLSVTPQEFDSLVAARFSSDIEQMIIKLVEVSMSGFVVADKMLMQEGTKKGVRIQQIPLHQSREQTINNTASISDVAQQRILVARSGSKYAQQLEIRDEALITYVANIAERFIRPNLTFNRAETEKRKAQRMKSVPNSIYTVQKGELIISDGEIINAKHIEVLKKLDTETKELNILQIFIGGAFLTLLTIMFTFSFAQKNIKEFNLLQKDVILMGIIFLSSLLAVRLSILLANGLKDTFDTAPPSFYYYVVPTMAGAMLLRFLVGSPAAFVYSICFSLVAGLQIDTQPGGNIFYTAYVLIGSLVAAGGVTVARQRTILLKAGLITGFVNMAMILAITTMSGQLVEVTVLYDLLAGFLAGIITAMVVNALIPATEVLLNYTTDIKLLELANLNHPVLRDLMVQAPGSHHHSVIVGSLVEAAAETIGANPLLARVMAYYHDIGKGKSPKYFAENQQHGENPHDKLEPSMSALILKRHVTDGLKLAKAHKLGEAIEAAIVEHHGTTRMSYFYEKAKALEEPEDPVKEEDYRYPGKKPQSKEAALVMLADSVEAAARSISDPNPARLLGVVQKVINMKFADGQLNECDLTLKDLHLIAKQYATILSGIHHSRPDYSPAVPKGGDQTRTKQHGSTDQKQKKKTDPSLENNTDSSAEGLKRLGIRE